MTTFFEMKWIWGAGVGHGAGRTSPIEGWYRGFMWSQGEVLLKKQSLLGAWTKGAQIRWNGSWQGMALWDGRGRGWRMGALAQSIQDGSNFGREDGLEDLHEGATFWAAAGIATESVFKELVPGDAHLFGENPGLVEQGVGPWEQSAPETVGEEPVITDDPEMQVGDMRDKTGDEIQNGEREGCFFLGVMIEEFETDFLAVIGQEAGFTQRGAFEVTAQIFGGGTVVVGLMVEVNDPFFLVKMIKPGIEGAVISEMGKAVREEQLAELVLLAQEVDDLITPHLFEFFVMEKTFVNPALAIPGEAADGGGEMEVKIAVELPAESMAGLENTRIESLLMRQIQDEVGGQGRGEIEEVAIEPEELPNLGGHGEGDVLPGGVGQHIEVGFDPFIGGLLSARGTETGFAGMGNGLGGAAGETALQMRPQQQGLAGHHFEHVDEDAFPKFGMEVDEMLPPILKNLSQADFSADEFHDPSFDQKHSQWKETVAALAA